MNTILNHNIISNNYFYPRVDEKNTYLGSLDNNIIIWSKNDFN